MERRREGKERKDKPNKQEKEGFLRKGKQIRKEINKQLNRNRQAKDSVSYESREGGSREDGRKENEGK